jgi:phage gpG-like protein
MDVTCEIDDRDVRRALALAGARLRDKSALTKELSEYQYQSTVTNFQREAFDGHPWPRLALSTQQAFLRSTGSLARGFASQRFTSYGAGWKVERLRTPGEVRAYWAKIHRERVNASRKAWSLTGRNARRGGANILRPTGHLIFQRIHPSHTPTEAHVRCNNDWAWVHNYGAVLKDGKLPIPRRTFLGIARTDERRIMEIVTRHMKEAGFRGL